MRKIGRQSRRGTLGDGWGMGGVVGVSALALAGALAMGCSAAAPVPAAEPTPPAGSASPEGQEHGSHEHAPGEGPHENGPHEHGPQAHAGGPHEHHHGGGPGGEQGHADEPHEHATGAPGAHGHAGPPPGSPGYHKDFSNAAGYSAHFDDPARDAWQRPEEVLDLMSIPAGSHVVDIGAGTGYFEARLARRVGPSGKVLALDVEPKMIEFLTRRVKEQQLPNVEPRLVPPDDPGLPPASASRILIVNTWHHIDARPSYAQKLAAALAPSGEVWIVDYTLDAEEGPPKKHRLSAEQVIRELEAGGLRATLVTPESLPRQFIVRASRGAAR